MARFANLLIPGGPTNTVGAVIATIAAFDASAATFSTAPDNVGFYVEGVLVGRETTTNAVVTTRVARSFKRIVGVTTALGAGLLSIVVMAGDAAIVASAATLDVTGSTIRLRVTGVAATTIEWTGYLIIYSGEFTG